MGDGNLWGAPRQRATRKRAREGDGKVWCVFGAPGSGVSTLVRLVAEATDRNVVVVAPTFGDLYEQFLVARAKLPDVILVDGYPTAGFEDAAEGPHARGPAVGPAQVSYLYDRRLLWPNNGGLIRVDASATRLVAGQRATRGGIASYLDGLGDLEARVRLLGLDYAVVHNEHGREGLVAATLDLARKVQLA